MEPQQVTPTVPPPIVEENPRRSNKTFKILLLVFLFILLSGVITYAVQNYQPQSQSDILPRPEDVPSPTLEEMSDWETYRSDEYGYSIQHPKDWFIEESWNSNVPGTVLFSNNEIVPGNVLPFPTRVPGSLGFTTDPLIEFGAKETEAKSVVELKSDYDYLASCNSNENSAILNEDEKQVNNAQVYYIHYSCESERGSFEYKAYYFLDGSGRIVRIRPDFGVDENINLFDQILSTFRFVEEESSISPAAEMSCGGSLLDAQKCPGGYVCKFELPNCDGCSGECVPE